jgi:drug/metabolite transporter (DMT)-like permease
MSSLIWPVFFAVLSPCLFAMMNLLDKFVVANKVKHIFSFAFYAGCVNLFLGVALGLFLDWQGYAFGDYLAPLVAGILSGSQFVIYYLLIQEEDVSNVVGFIYFYPLIVALLSFLFLHEVLSLVSYIGMAMILLGVFLLSVRVSRIRLKATAWMIATLILVIALYEFLVKVSVTRLPILNGTAICIMATGLTAMLVILSRKARQGIAYEFRNLKWAVINECMTFLAISTTFLAMAGLPATIVSSIAAIQPMAVLLFEQALHGMGLRLSRDPGIRHKILPIGMIVIGVILLYLPQAFA